MSSGEELIEALFGGPGTLTAGEIVFGLVAAAGVVVFVLKKKNSLILVLVSPEVARTAGIDVARLNLLYLRDVRAHRSPSGCATSGSSSWAR